MQKKPKPKKAVLITVGIVLYLAILNLISHVRGGEQSGIVIGTVIVCIALLTFLLLASLFVKQIRGPAPNREVSVHEEEIQILDLGEWKIDLFCAITLAAVIFVTLFYFLGFAKAGIDAPYGYGGDALGVLAEAKAISEGDYWRYSSWGAPYDSPKFDYTASFFTNIDMLIKKAISFFVREPSAIVNWFFLLIFPMCAISTFYVLRCLSIKRPLSLFGAVLFALSPYIFGRNTGHMTLSACYFVPLSILLCVWAFQSEDSYLKFKRGVLYNRKNVAAVIFACLIANNGTGYYAFFTCFFLCVVALYNLVRERKWGALRKPVITVCLILFFFLLALAPVIIYEIQNGSNLDIAKRGAGEAELLGLKISQFFVPLTGHGNNLIQKFINAYNGQMLLINENVTSYLGVGAIIGFLISLCMLFVPQHDADDVQTQRMHLLSRLNIFAILFAGVGGFTSLFMLAIKAIRSFNRISIYIMFMCVTILCISLQKLWECCHTSRKKGLFFGMFTLLLIVCLYDQLPTWGGNDPSLAVYKASYEADGRFIEAIEDQLQSYDMVYQLPYHKYPEAGPVNNMSDYHLLLGYLHSDTLRWSYGGMKGRESDQWNEAVSLLPMDTKLDVIIRAGFRGIYVDALAYTQEELAQLRQEIEFLIGAQPIFSEDGNLLFYNLYPYINEHPDLLGQATPGIEEIKWFKHKINVGEDIPFNNTVKIDAHRYFTNGVYGTEDNFAWTAGKEANLTLYLPDAAARDMSLYLNFCMIFNAPQRMIVTCGDAVLFDEVLADPSVPAKIPIPAECIQDHRLELTLQFPGAISPVALGLSADTRDLAFALTSLSIQYAEEATRKQ